MYMNWASIRYQGIRSGFSIKQNKYNGKIKKNTETLYQNKVPPECFNNNTILYCSLTTPRKEGNRTENYSPLNQFSISILNKIQEVSLAICYWAWTIIELFIWLFFLNTLPVRQVVYDKIQIKTSE